MSEEMLVAEYEDGTRYETPVSMWRSANEHDQEAMAVLEQMLNGETVSMGGGAQPYCRMWIDLVPAPKDHDKATQRAESGHAQ